MFCPRCGSQLPDGARFCSRCGSTLGGEKPVAPAPAPAQQPAGPKPRRRRVVAIVVAALAVLLAGGGAAWWFLLRPQPVWVVTNTGNAWNDSMSDGSEMIFANTTPYAYAVMLKACPDQMLFTQFGTTERVLGTDGVTRSLTVNGQAESLETDDHGNVVALVGRDDDVTATSYRVTYDDQGRPTRTDTLTGGALSGYVLYAYADDGSFVCDGYDESGSITQRRSVGADGVTDWIEVYDEGQVAERYEYEDGGLSSLISYGTGGVETGRRSYELERDDSGRVTAIVSSDGYWGAMARSVERFVLDDTTLATRVCLEYDENGNVARVYIPWEPAARDALIAVVGLIPNEDTIVDMRYEYQLVDNPTPLVRVLRRNLL